IELAHEVESAAHVLPGDHLSGVHAERDAVEREGLVLAGEEIRSRVRALDGTVLGRVEHAEGRHELTGAVYGDGELAPGHLADPRGEELGAAEYSLERTREAVGEAPADGGLGHDGGRRAGREDAGKARLLQESATFHLSLSQVISAANDSPGVAMPGDRNVCSPSVMEAARGGKRGQRQLISPITKPRPRYTSVAAPGAGLAVANAGVPAPRAIPARVEQAASSIR